jgi:hypothetical protein
MQTRDALGARVKLRVDNDQPVVLVDLIGQRLTEAFLDAVSKSSPDL